MLLMILGVAAVTRLAGLGKIPEGILPDEACAAYNAWALMTEGMDNRGYGFPVYFIAWGSGMNTLYSYLSIPFLWLFGATTMVYRIPQALFGILGVLAAYVLGRELLDEKFGLLFSFLLAINPWNIMIDRFALESNLAPAMFLISLTLLVLGIRKTPGIFRLRLHFWIDALQLCSKLDRGAVVSAAISAVLSEKHSLWKTSVVFNSGISCHSKSVIVFCRCESEFLPEIKTRFSLSPDYLRSGEKRSTLPI